MKRIALYAELPSEARFLATMIFGCALIAIGSQIQIPMVPVPFTLQTLALFILALTQSPKEVLASTVAYLFCATCGLPVLSGAANSFWIAEKSGGYLIAFPMAVYLIARIRQVIHPLGALFVGQMVIFVSGWAWLAVFVGPYVALMKGVLIFIPSAICKILSAFAWVRWRER